MSIEFRQYGKTSRLFRDVVITEKLDGTNSAVIIERIEGIEGKLARIKARFQQPDPFVLATILRDGVTYNVAAQSRNRLITPGKTTDNYGFAQWVRENANTLITHLGVGRHYGEWWGQGIARKYGMDRKVFSLFNTYTYKHLVVAEPVGDAYLTIVPVLYEGVFTETAVTDALVDLHFKGSVAAPGFKKPEGVCVYHEQSKQVFKVTLDNNDKGKWQK